VSTPSSPSLARRPGAGLLVLAILTLAGPGWPASASDDRPGAEAHLVALERAKWQVGAPDIANWERVLADDFLGIEYGPRGLRRASRADVLALLREGGLAMRENTLDGFTVTWVTDEVALVTYRLALDVPLGTFRAQATTGWVRRDGEWRTVFHQITEEPTSRALWVGGIAGFFVSLVMLGLIRRLFRADRPRPPAA
jgi:hypothetical protein